MQIWQIGNIQIQMYLNLPDLKIIQEKNDTTQQFSLNKHKSVYFSFSLFLKSCKCFSLRKKRLQGAVFLKEKITRCCFHEGGKQHGGGKKYHQNKNAYNLFNHKYPPSSNVDIVKIIYISYGKLQSQNQTNTQQIHCHKKHYVKILLIQELNIHKDLSLI